MAIAHSPGAEADPRPFVGHPWCAVSLPEPTGDPFNAIDTFCRLLVNEAAELEAELGCPVRFDADGDIAQVLIGPAARNPVLASALAAAGRQAVTEPSVWVDRERARVVVDGPDIAAVGSAFQLLRTAIRTRSVVTVCHLPGSPPEVLDLLRDEVAATWPGFALRGLDWPAILDRHEDDVLAHSASLPSLQRLFAELQDAHTAIRDPRTNARLPYRAWIDPERAWFTHIPTWTAGWAAGCRPGDAIPGVDGSDWWERTGATPRTRAAIAGYRWLAGTVGETRELRATSRGSGADVAWTETYRPVPWDVPISWRTLPSGTGYLRIRGWLFAREWLALLDAALAGLADCPRLIVDLRGNGGGQLIAAQHFRDRFLSEPTELGTIRFSLVQGGLGDPAQLVGHPVTHAPGWRKPVGFLVDRQTYSASEDAVLGLGGLPHVQIVGEPTGGGSGRPRTLALGPEINATISTALTFDRSGHCVEGFGLPVDIPLPVDEAFRDPAGMPAAAILEMADRGW